MSPSEITSVDSIMRLSLDHLQPTIYLSDEGVYTKLRGKVGRGGDSQDMLSLAIKIKSESFRDIKVRRESHLKGLCSTSSQCFGIFYDRLHN